jgi:hypothetical protein
VVNGDLGTSPNPSVTGFGGAPAGTVNGSIHRADATAAEAQADLNAAYNNASGQGPVTTIATELGGQTLTPGVYDSQSGTFGITGTLTLDAQGDPNAVFIFKTASTLITASGSDVSLINGATACGLYWRVGSSATLGSSSGFSGNILASASISLNDDVTVTGRLLARNGAVTLINDTVNRPACASGDGGGDGGPGDGGGPGGGPGDGPAIDISDGPTTGPERCIDRGFRAEFSIPSDSRLRRVDVFLNGDLIKTTTLRRFSAWIATADLRPGEHMIRVVAVDAEGRRDAARRTFRRCAPAVPNPEFRSFERRRCTQEGFRARFTIRHPARVRRAMVFVDGRLVRTSTNRHFSVWIQVAGMRFARHTIRLVVVNIDGRRSTAARSFRRCLPAAPNPAFTG